MPRIVWLTLIAVLAVAGASSWPASATATFGPRDYRVFGPTGDQGHSVLLTIAVQTNAAWQQGKDEPVTVTVDVTRGAAVTSLGFQFLVPALWAQPTGAWTLIDGNPSALMSNDSHISVTVPEQSGRVLSAAWFQVQLDMTLTFTNGSTHSISGWTTGRDFGPISVAATLFYGITDWVPSLSIVIALIVIPVAFILYARYARRRKGRSEAEPSKSSRRGS
jgi:hypothetical protein